MIVSNRRRAAVLLLFSVLWIASLSAAAGAEIPDTQPTPTLPVRVQVLEFATDVPLAGVTVWVNEQIAGRTDDRGVAIVRVSRGAEVVIAVNLDGYYGLGVEDTVWSDGESWQFWLKPVTRASYLFQGDGFPSRNVTSPTSQSSLRM